MIYKNLNSNIQDKIDNIVERKKIKFKNNLLMDLLAYHLKII